MFKTVTDRKEFARLVNFRKYPVVHGVLRENEYGWSLGKIRIDAGKDYLGRAELMIYRDDLCLRSSCPGCCISARFCYQDMIEDAEYATCPILKANSKLTLILDNPARKKAMCIVMETGRVDLNCMEPIMFPDADMRGLLWALGRIEKAAAVEA